MCGTKRKRFEQKGAKRLDEGDLDHMKERKKALEKSTKEEFRKQLQSLKSRESVQSQKTLESTADRWPSQTLKQKRRKAVQGQEPLELTASKESVQQGKIRKKRAQSQEAFEPAADGETSLSLMAKRRKTIQSHGFMGRVRAPSLSTLECDEHTKQRSGRSFLNAPSTVTKQNETPQ